MGNLNKLGARPGGGPFRAGIKAIGDAFASFISDTVSGDDQPGSLEPIYSPALAKRHKGQYQEAIALIQKELKRFPDDYQGQMLQAEIQAQNLHDLPGAATTIQQVCQQPKHSPSAIAFALNSLADWQLALAKDPDAAAQALEQIIQRFPNSQFSMQASQRLAHLATPAQLLESEKRKPIKVKPGIRNLGLKKVDPAELIKTTPPEAVAGELVRHLEQHPLDVEAREQLALLYAFEFHQLDLAAAQFEQLIACPNLPPKQTVHWLNQLADVQVRIGGDRAAAEATLKRILELYPGSAFAAQAESRIMTLPNELRGQRESAPIKMGEYEQRLGLKMKPPYRPPGTPKI